MKSKPNPLLVLLLIVIIAGAVGYWYFSNNPDEWQQVLVDFGLNEIPLLQPPEAEAKLPLTASGFVEAKEVAVASEVGGRIERMAVIKGDEVTAGQPVIQIDTALLDAQKQQIEAQIALAEAQLQQVRVGTPAEAIAVAEAAITVAEVQGDAAKQAWDDAILLRDTPQQLDAQIDAAKSKVEIAWLQRKQAEYLRDAADLGEDIAKEMWDITQQYPVGDDNQAAADWNLASMGVWQGYISWESAKAAYAVALNERDTLIALREDPVQGDVLVAQAEADYQAKMAAVEIAKANLEQTQAPVPQAQIDVLEANLAQARTQLATLAAQIEKFTLVSPLDGVVVQQIAHQGEIAIPGTALLTVSDLDEVTLTVYVSEVDYGRIRQGQNVDVQVDSYPGETFAGVITRISDEAEFTPKNVQTQEERVSLVYAVKITIPNESHQLKPGVPADVVFIEAAPR